MAEKQKAPIVPPQPGAISEQNIDITAHKSLGERLSPLLVIAMECCLVDALLLVMAGFFVDSGGPLLPIWAIFLVIFFFYLLSYGLRRFMDQWLGTSLPGGLRRTLVALVLESSVLLSLICCVWLRFYAQTFALFDPAWIQTFNFDLGQVDRDFQILVLGFLFSLLAWLSYQTMAEKSNAALLLTKGSPLFLILTGVSLGEGLLRSSVDYWQTLLLLQAFVGLGLLAQSLQTASAKRRYHAVGLVESTRYQERIIFQILGALGLLVVVANVVVLFINGNLKIYIPHNNPFLMPPPGGQAHLPKMPPPPNHYGFPANFPHISLPLAPSEAALGLLGIAISGTAILSMLIGFSYLMLKYLKIMRRKKKKKLVKDERKSLWTWTLFLSQCKALFFALLTFLRLRWRKPVTDKSESSGDTQPAQPEVRSIREVYQAFLQKATRQGYPRAQNETPYEFRLRLYAQEPLLEPELEAITEAYARVRYGGGIPHTDEITRVQEVWSILDGKWREETRGAL